MTGTVDSIVARLGTPALGGSYFTISDENNYTIWAILKKCYERGMVYKGTDVMPWCPRCATGLSEHEIATEGYEERVHTSVFVRFPLLDRPGESLLVWTTTPWTLSSNVAAAVHPDLTYQLVQPGEHRLLPGQGRRSPTPSAAQHTVLEELQGQPTCWAGATAAPSTSCRPRPRRGDEHRVIAWKDVGEAEGTGIVHIAPGCGKEDFELGKEHGLAVMAPLDEYGVFMDGFAWLTGLGAAEAAPAHLRRTWSRRASSTGCRSTPTATPSAGAARASWSSAWSTSGSSPWTSCATRSWTSPSRSAGSPTSAWSASWTGCSNMDDWMISKKRYWGLALPIYRVQGVRPLRGHRLARPS